MPDLRERVEEDRGLLKKIQMHIPGFAGYRRREDLRTADNILRIQLADRLVKVKERVEAARTELVRNYQTGELENVGGMIFKMTELDGRVRHAEHGYSGISADVRIEEPELNRIYEFDLALLEGISALMARADEVKACARKDNDAVHNAVDSLRQAVEQFEDTFERRMKVVSGTEVA
jgi:hypothetical protein